MNVALAIGEKNVALAIGEKIDRKENWQSGDGTVKFNKEALFVRNLDNIRVRCEQN